MKGHEFALKLNLNVPFTTYYGLVNAILKNWKANLKNHIQNIQYETTNSTLTTSSVYSSPLKTMFVCPTDETKILLHGFTENTIQKVYLMPFTVTNEIKIILLQFRVTYGVMPTCTTLYRDEFSESPICNLCNTKEQMLDHLLINCNLTEDFWSGRFFKTGDTKKQLKQ